jgi:hypothetical protein
MDITEFVFNQREEVLLAGDYNAYRAHTTRKLHKLRKRLGQTTPKGRKYTAKAAVSAENVSSNVAYVLSSFTFPPQVKSLSVDTYTDPCHSPDMSTSSSLAQNEHGHKRCK